MSLHILHNLSLLKSHGWFNENEAGLLFSLESPVSTKRDVEEHSRLYNKRKLSASYNIYDYTRP